MSKLIQLPSGRNVTLGEYTRSWRALRLVNPKALIANWSHFPTEAQDILREIEKGCADRINRHIPGFGKGRKWSYEWQSDVMRTAQAVNTPRLAVHWIPFDLRARLGHRLADVA